MSACNCRDCAEGRISRYAFRHGGEDWEEDYDELLPYHKNTRSTYAGKRKRACKKSKTGEKCDFTVVLTNHKWYDVVTCSRCGKHGTYRWKH